MDRSQKIEAVFKRLDKDRSGDIDKSEIKRFFKKAAGENHAQRNETADKLLDYFDTDGDGCIDYDEFKQGIKNLERGEGAAFLKSKLEFFFENERVDPKDGQLKTFALFLKHSTDKQDAQDRWDEAKRLQDEKERVEEEIRSKASAVFSKLDLDGNGWIDAMELKRFFRKIAGESQLERRRTAAELLRFFDRNGDGLIDRLEFELGCLLVQQSEGDEFIEKKLELLFAVDDSCGPVAIKRGPSAVGLSPSTVPEGMSPGVDSDTLDTPTKRRGQDQSGALSSPRDLEERAWMNKVEAVFFRLDTDGSGDIDSHELKQFFKAANKEHSLQRRQTAAELIKYFDADGDGHIDLDEFRDGMNELMKVEGKFLLRKIDILFADTIDPEAKAAAKAAKAAATNPLIAPIVEEIRAGTGDGDAQPDGISGDGDADNDTTSQKPKSASGFMQIYGPKEGLRLYMAQQAAIKAAKEAKAAEEAAKQAAAIQEMAWYERCPDLTPAIASLRSQLTTLQEIIVPCSTSGDEFVRVLDLIHPTVQGDFGAAQTEIFDLALEFAVACLRGGSPGSPANAAANKSIFSDFENYALAVAEKHFREGRRLSPDEPAENVNRTSGGNDDSSRSIAQKGDSTSFLSFTGMSGAQDVVAARQVLDFFTAVLELANNALGPDTENLDNFSKVFGTLHGAQSFYRAAKLAAQIKKIARRRNAFDDLDDDEAVGNGAQVDDDDHEDEAVQVVEAHEVGLEDDGALAIDATPSKNPFDELSDEEGNEDDSPAGSARPDSPDDQPTKTESTGSTGPVEAASKEIGWDDSLFESPLPFVVTEARRLFKEGIISQSEYVQSERTSRRSLWLGATCTQPHHHARGCGGSSPPLLGRRYEQMVVGQIKFEREKRRDSMAPVPQRLSRSQSARVDAGKARRLSDQSMSPASPHLKKASSLASGLRGSRALREPVSASPRNSVSSVEARIQAKMALAASRRRAGAAKGSASDAKGASAQTQKTEQALQKAMEGMSANAAKTAETLEETREMNHASKGFASAAKEMRLKQQAKKKKFFGLF